MSDTKTIYRDDLAHIHVDGFGFHWERAAPTILRYLRDKRLGGGRVVDLGCGGGQWLERLARDGYDVWGVDQSTTMVALARKRVPQARIVRGSIADVELPSCDVVTALGEPINYLPGRRPVRRLLRNVFRALCRGGAFIFDAREPARDPVPPRRTVAEGNDWALFAEITENGLRGDLTREISTFRRRGTHFRRRRETHRLKLYPKATMLGWLRDTGFRVRHFRGYGAYRFPPRQSSYFAIKP